MNTQYQTIVGLPPEPTFAALITLLTGAFTDQSDAEMRSDLIQQHTKTPLLLWLAVDNQQIVGCKLGYKQKPGHFYSWLGCVHPTHRGRGIAGELMRRQHNWCQENGYHTLRTHTYNQWREMLILNLRAGFDIIGTVQQKRGLMIVLEKTL